jgi:hypothetical protein
MSSPKHGWLAIAAVAAVAVGSQLTPATALADPQGQPQQELLHNITYRARVDGVARGATIRYAAEGNQFQSANPTMVPGRIFEANTVLPGSQQASMKVSIEWPYSVNLHCEILVDDVLVAQADDFIAPRFMPARDDPDYGALTCEAPVSGAANTIAPDPAAPPPVDHGVPPPA